MNIYSMKDLLLFYDYEQARRQLRTEDAKELWSEITRTMPRSYYEKPQMIPFTPCLSFLEVVERAEDPLGMRKDRPESGIKNFKL
jgi:hypothetical protein